jgi:hypothetical protein
MTGMRVSTAKRPSARVAPTQLRSVQTRERLLDVAGELLADVGIELTSTTLICARQCDAAGALSLLQGQVRGTRRARPPADERQNEVLMQWLPLEEVETIPPDSRGQKREFRNRPVTLYAHGEQG